MMDSVWRYFSCFAPKGLRSGGTANPTDPSQAKKKEKKKALASAETTAETLAIQWSSRLESAVLETQ